MSDTIAPRTAEGSSAASGFHLSDTIDWSSQSAQDKNRILVVTVQIPAPTRLSSAEVVDAPDRFGDRE